MRRRRSHRSQCAKKTIKMNEIFPYIFLGIVAGIFSGLIGIGGGIIMIPALVLIFGFSQHHAQGTTLAVMIPPIGLMAAWVYYKQGYVNLKAAGLICLGFIIGGYFGAKIATTVSSAILEKIFGVIFLLLSLKMIFLR